MIWLALGLLAQLQDDFCPLREGTVFTYEVKEKSGERDLECAVRGTRTMSGQEWTEVSNFMLYSKSFLRTSEDGLEFRAPEYGDRTILLFKKGARIGDVWNSELTPDETIRFRLEVQENVEVPAGTFRAHRIAFVISNNRKTSVQKESEGVIWIAPGTGVVKGWISRHADCDAAPTHSFALKKIEHK